MSDKYFKIFIRVPTKQNKKKETEATNIFSYQYLQGKLGIKKENSFDLFLISVLIGKLFVDSDKIPKELSNGETYSRYSYIYDKPYMPILKAIAIEEVGEISILNDIPAMVKIWERYACAGFDELSKWYHDKNIDFESKLYEVLLEYYNDYKDKYHMD